MLIHHFRDHDHRREPDRERHAHDGFGRGPHRFGRQRRGGGFAPREGRTFDSGDLRFVILSSLHEKPRHGYEIIKELGERVGGGYSPSPGVVYPTLTMLEEIGYATAAQDQVGRKLYTLTPEGEALLAANRDHVDAIFARLDGVNGDRRGDFAPVMRGMENLRMAVMLRMRRRDATSAQIQAIADALDGAAKAIERA